MTLIVEQKPLYKTLAAAQKLILSVTEDSGVVVNEKRVKFIFTVYAGKNRTDVTGQLPSTLVGDFKTTPNDAGAGMIDLSPIIETKVSSDNLATDLPISNIIQSTSQYKANPFTSIYQFPVHIVDKYALGNNSTTFLLVKIQVEYLGADVSQPNTVNINGSLVAYSDLMFVFNGVVYNEDVLSQEFTYNWDFGYNYAASENNFILRNTEGMFLTLAPTTQYARLTDYGTIGFFNMLNAATFSFNTSGGAPYQIKRVVLKLYNSAGVQLGTDIDIDNEVANGGSGGTTSFYSYSHFVFMGAYPANFDNWSTVWDANKADVSYYTLQAESAGGSNISKLYTVHIICDSSFGYEGIRLGWLNKFGMWDYYTFNKKSVRGINTRKTNYTKLDGTWNETTYKPFSYKGGKKNFRVNSKERIKINTDYLTDAESIWIEGLINSPEVYIINEFTESDLYSHLRRYIEPVMVTTSDFVRKTQANDNLIQYTIEIERNKDQRQQAV